MAVTVHDTGNATNTTITVALPTYTADDFLVVAFSRNQPGTFTFGSNVTATEIASASGRINAFRIEPDTLSETDFTIFNSTNSVWTWALIKVTGIDLNAAIAATSDSNSNTSSAIPIPTLTLGYTANGTEEAFVVSGVNSTATWGTNGDTIFNTSSGNAGMIVQNFKATQGGTTVTYADIDRGNNGSTRIESSAVFALQLPASSSTARRMMTFF